MDGHFRAFSFVDRITSVQPGVQVRGLYQIPPGIAEFPLALAAEAVGQLAAWSAMARLDFKRRPVAGIANSVELLSPVRPGQTLELAAEIEEVDFDAVAYCGTAHCGWNSRRPPATLRRPDAAGGRFRRRAGGEKSF